MTNNEETAAHRLADKKEQYNKLRARITRSLAEYRSIEKSLNEALDTLNTAELNEEADS